MSFWAARSAACKIEDWPVDRSEPQAWGTSHGPDYDNLCSDGYAQEDDRGGARGGGRNGEARFLGEIANRPDAVAKMVERLAKKHGKLSF
jgi:hypothetical protein